MKFGYARVSKMEQNLSLQIDALKIAGCDEIITDEISGAISNRPGLNNLIQKLRKNDELIVWRLDRLGRSLSYLVNFVNELSKKEIRFTSLTENIETTTNGGKLIFNIFASLAEFERNLIRERTIAGLMAARLRGRIGGRPTIKKEVVDMALDLYESKDYSINTICEITNISRGTLYKYINQKKKLD